VSAASSLAFDHDRILADGVERARAKLEYTPLAAAFCPVSFTVAELRQVYEIVWGASLDPRDFHRNATGTPGFLEPTGAVTTGDRGRPAPRSQGPYPPPSPPPPPSTRARRPRPAPRGRGAAGSGPNGICGKKG